MTTTYKPRVGDYVKATIEGRIRKDEFSDNGTYLIQSATDAHGYYSVRLAVAKDVQKIDPPFADIKLPTKEGTVVLVDPTNAKDELCAYIRVNEDKEYPWWDAGSSGLTHDQLAEQCAKFGYKVVK